MSSALSTCVHAADEVGDGVENIQVTATRLPRNIEDIAGTVSLITDTEIRQTLAEDLDDLIRYLPGVSMSTRARGGNEGFTIRGIGGNRILTMIDGVRSNDLYDASVSVYGKDSFELDDLKAVEIVRGPASVLYGADAMGGAVLLRTKTAQDYLDGDDAYLGLRASYNSANDMGKVGLTAASQWRGFDAVAQYTRRDFSEAEVAGPATLNPQDGTNDALMVKLGRDHSDNFRSTLTLDYFQEDVDTRLLNELSETVQNALGRDETERLRITLAQEWTPQATIADHVDSRLYWQKTDALQHTLQERTSYSFINPMNPATYGGTAAHRISDFSYYQETTGIDLSARKGMSLGQAVHTVVYGVTLEKTATERPRNRCETELATGASTCAIAEYPFAPPEVFPNKTFPDAETYRSGVYVQDEIVMGRLTLTPGMRYDRYKMEAGEMAVQGGQNYGYAIDDVKHNEVTLNLGLIYDLTPDASLFMQYAEGFRAPNFSETNQSFANLGFGYALLPNPDLDPETSRNLELGLRAGFGDTNLSLALYNNDYEDFIETGFVGMEDGISLFQEQNIAEVNIHGVELQIDHAFNEQWSLRGAMAWSRGDNEEADTALNSVEPLTAVVGLRYQSAGGRWSVESMLTAVAEKDRVATVEDVTADSYEVLDLVATMNLTQKTALRLGVFNILDEEYARWANIFSFSASDTELIEQARESGTTARLSFSHQF